MRIRRLAGIVGVAVVLAVAPNVLAWHHAGALVEFTPTGERPLPPEHLSAAARARALLFGVSVPRPRADRDPGAYGLAATRHTVDGPVGPLAVHVIRPIGRREHRERVVVVAHGYAAEHTQTY